MNTMKTQVFICTIAELLKLFQATMIMIPPDIESRFIKAKNPKVYNIRDDPFDKLTIDQRIDLCDMVIDCPTYMWHKRRIDMSKYSELPIIENYQRTYKLNTKLKKEVNELEFIGISLKNHGSIPFKRIYCCAYEDGNSENNDEFRQELYISYGEEPDYPFILTRYGKNARLEVVGIIDKNELTWKAIQDNVTSSDLVKRLSNSQPTVCSLKDQGIHFEICSRVHNHIFSNEESVEEYGFDEDISIEQCEFDSYNDSSINVDSSDDDSLKKLKVSAASEEKCTTAARKKFISAAEEEFTAATEEQIANNTYFKEKAIDEDAGGEVIRDASFKDKIIDNDAEKKVIGHTTYEDKGTEEDVKEEVMADATFEDNSIIDGRARNERDTHKYFEYSSPSVFNWFDQGKRACNTRYVSVNNEKPDTLPVESLRCIFYANGRTPNKFFVALINHEENKVSVAVMRPQNLVYNERTSPLEVTGTVHFIHH